MLNHPLRLWFFVLLWMLISGCHADAPSFTPPAEREKPVSAAPWPANHFLVLAYHDVEDSGADQRFLSVRTSALNDQLNWLKTNGYQPVSVQQILNARDGGAPLPPKAVLLSFDDGYGSFYTRVFPLLKAYNWPALWAPVGKWVDTPENRKVDFGGQLVARDKFATWQMVAELSSSPLVEIGAHTWDSHYGITANPQGSREPAVANRQYLTAEHRYENEAEFTTRIQRDINLITGKLRQVTGKSPRAWVWPYGAANGTTLALVQAAGYSLSFTLNDGLGDIRNLGNIPRVLIANNPSLEKFALSVATVQERSAMRVAHVDLDYIYDENPAQQAKNLDKLIQRMYDLRVTTVFLQAFADPAGDGNIKALYFPNRWLPMREDLFNRVAWQLQTRAGVTVYAWMPVLSFALDNHIPRIEQWDPQTGKRDISRQQYRRLSPYSAQARQKIIEIYEDLASHAAFSGILYHDDALMNDFEDASPDALAAYARAGFSGDIGQIRRDPTQFARWTRFKSQTLIDFTTTLTQRVRAIRGPQIKSARNIYAMPVLDPKSEAWFAQNMNDFLASYDWVAPMAMPLMEGESPERSEAWLANFVAAVAKYPGGLKKSVFELQARDWRSGKGGDIPSAQLARWMDILQLNGARSLGYYPDNAPEDSPDIKVIRASLSNWWYPDNIK